MMRLRKHPGTSDGNGGKGTPSSGVGPGCAPGGQGRLNLLLSFAGWEPNPWVERLPKMLEPMGVRSLTAGSGVEAGRVIEQHTVHIAVVDLGLPLDPAKGHPSGGPSGGARLLEILRRLSQPPPTVVVRHDPAAREMKREMTAALRAGAFAVVDRPREQRELEIMLEVLRRCMNRHYGDQWPGRAG